MKRVLSALLVLLPLLAYGQGPSAVEERKMNLRILSLIDEYERTCSLSEPRSAQEFLDLFASPAEACVYNDNFRSPSFQEKVTPQEYVSSLSLGDNALLTVRVGDIKKEGPFFRHGGQWHRKISMAKSLRIMDSAQSEKSTDGKEKPSEELYEDERDFRLIVDFQFNPLTGKCKISSIGLSSLPDNKPRTKVGDKKSSPVPSPTTTTTTSSSTDLSYINDM